MPAEVLTKRAFQILYMLYNYLIKTATRLMHTSVHIATNPVRFTIERAKQLISYLSGCMLIPSETASKQVCSPLRVKLVRNYSCIRFRRSRGRIRQEFLNQERNLDDLRLYRTLRRLLESRVLVIQRDFDGITVKASLVSWLRY